MENPDYSLVEKYFSDVPNIKSLFGRKPKEIFPDKILLSNELVNGIDKICETFQIDNNQLITAIYWISFTFDNLDGIGTMDIIGDGELTTNKEKFHLYDHFKNSGDSIFNRPSIVIKAKGDNPPPSITISDPYLAGIFVELMRDIIYMDNLFKDDVIQENRVISFPGKGKKAITKNWYVRSWIIHMLKLFEENTNPRLNESRALLLISQILFINEYFFYSYKKEDNQVVDKTPKNVMDKDFYAPDIVEHLKRLIGADLEPN